MRESIKLLYEFCKLLNSDVVQDIDCPELLVPKSEPMIVGEAFPVSNKTAYESGKNCSILVKQLTEREFECLLTLAEPLCKCVYRYLNILYPEQKFAVHALVQLHGMFSLQFHQIEENESFSCDWEQRGPCSEERIFSVTDDSHPIKEPEYITHYDDIRESVVFLIQLSQLLHYKIVRDPKHHELIVLECCSQSDTITFEVSDKTEYEAMNNHIHFLGDITESEFSFLLTISKLLCQCIHANLKQEFPERRFAVYASVHLHDSFIIRFHQIWQGELLYYSPDDFNSGEDRVFAIIG